MPDRSPALDDPEFGVFTADAVVDEPEEFLEPLPQCCPAYNGVSLMPFQLMLPDGPSFIATFHVTAPFTYHGGLIRFGNQKPVWREFRDPKGYLGPITVVPRDRIIMRYWP